MAQVVAFDDVKALQEGRGAPRKGRASARTTFFGSPDTPDLPDACLSEYDPGRASFSGPHFHTSDQFQVVVCGKGRIGRHDLGPYSVHFTRAYTPYGPVVTDADAGMNFFLMRTHRDAGAQHLPEKLEQLQRIRDRRPWQITRTATFPELISDAAAPNILLHAIPGVKDEQGLAAYTLSMKANSQTCAPDPAHGDGQYLLVLRGSLSHNQKEHQAYTLVFVEPKESALQIHAGPQGLQALILNFPLRNPRTLHTEIPASAAGSRKWQCVLCSFAYDEALGLPGEGIPAGTRWADVPDSWSCPDCSAAKSEFRMVEV